MSIQTLYQIGALVSLIPFGFIVYEIIQERRTMKRKEELNRLFRHYWSGKPEDELYAWYRVRMYLRRYDATSEKMTWVEQKIESLDTEHIKSRIYIGARGEMVDDTPEPAQ